MTSAYTVLLSILMIVVWIGYIIDVFELSSFEVIFLGIFSILCYIIDDRLSELK